MKQFLCILYVLYITSYAQLIKSYGYKGCYKNTQQKQFQVQTLDDCIENCKDKHYRYAGITQNMCQCVYSLNNQKNNTCTISCNINTTLSCGSTDNSFLSFYSTKVIGPGPPTDLKITNVTESSAHVMWTKPAVYTTITGYELVAQVIHSFSNSMSHMHSWVFSNNTFRNEITKLFPGTEYNLSVKALSAEGPGMPVWALFETIIGEPDQAATNPTMVKREGTTILIKPSLVENQNGPVTAYRFVVIDVDEMQVVQAELLQPFEKAQSEGLSYYIAAEISAEDAAREFLIGDGKKYNGFYNAPLKESVNYIVITGVVSRWKGITKIRYLDADMYLTKVHVLPLPGSAVVLGLSVAIGLGVVLLLVGVIVLIVLRRRYPQRRRRRLNDVQELSVQGPMIEVSNHGYIPDEQPGTVNHYKSLKERVWNIPRDKLHLNSQKILGFGQFGHVVSSSVLRDGSQLQVSTYIVSDGDLTANDKRQMLRELDLLIRVGSHENLISLVGTCESPENVYIVFQDASTILKEMLLNHRENLLTEPNFTETQTLFSIGVGRGLEHLYKKKLVHKYVCAQNVLITGNFIPKLGGHGLCKYNRNGKTLDCTRWWAPEVLCGRNSTVKSDVWSYACFLWEVACLGATPYANLDNNVVKQEICQGVRLKQLRHITDTLYQLMLDCWQSDQDERPSISEVLSCLQNNALSVFTFHMYTNQPYNPELEFQQEII